MRQYLDPSELGTKEYWDQAYAREISNHAADTTDEGTIWFDDSGAEEKMIEMLDRLDEEGLLSKEDESTRIADLGTGNGHMLFELRENDWEGDLVGVDYSETSVQLARQIAEQRYEGEVANAPSFEQWDILNEKPGAWLKGGFHALLDKGTFDAISLSSETDAQGRRICETYRDRVIPLLRPDGFLVITSCNWTEDEMLQWFVGPESSLELYDEVKYPTFTFGGQQGQSVCTLALRKRSP
ncbi:hypothetical protein MBLNU457_6427t1 [Dothideomycetes sp. NU457]